jgi:LuxR family transcriptional regulator, maltose regulon positive regulatory protein
MIDRGWRRVGFASDEPMSPELSYDDEYLGELKAAGSRVPRLTHRSLVGRQDVVARCAEENGASTALLSAPAGYGKTTVLSQWADADRRPFGWIPLDERFDDPALLVGSIAETLDELESVGDSVLAPLRSPQPNLAEVVVPRLCESLARRRHPFVLVLDDLHFVRNPESLQPVAAIAESMPVGSKLAIASRDEPDIHLGRLRARRLLVELHAEDLAMTESEASVLFDQAGLELEPATVEALVERTEGWPAALYLAALALAGTDEVGRELERFFGDDRFIADYLRDELLAGMPVADLDFLTRTSVLDRLSGPLCDAVLGRSGSADILRRLARSNLLLIPLDRRDREYRYHALLRGMLEAELHRLGVDQESELHTRASRWYAGASDVDRAVSHAIAGGDLSLAGDLIWAATPTYASSGREITLHRWLENFSEDQLLASPPLCLSRATSCLNRGNGGGVEHWTDAAAQALESVVRADHAVLTNAGMAIRASGAARAGVVAMREDVESAYSMLSSESPIRPLCRFISGVSFHLTGDLDSARSLLEEGSRQGAATNPHLETLCLAQLALLALDEGDPVDAARLADQAIAGIDHFGLNDAPTSAVVYSSAALARATRGRTTEAAADAQVAADLIPRLRDFSPWYEAEARIVLARAHLLLDDIPGARAWLAEAGRYLKRTPDAEILREWLETAWKQADTAKSATDRWPLSPAELRLLRFLPTHLTYPEIAAELFVSPNTVKTQARSIYEKLGVSSRNEAVACARAAGLVESNDGNHD